MLVDLYEVTLDTHAARAREHKHVQDLLDNSVHVSKCFARHAFLALPLPFGRHEASMALMAIDAIALGAFLRLPYHLLAYLTQEVFNDICKFRRHEILRLDLNGCTFHCQSIIYY